jgi:hypothetical protein
MPSVYDTTKKDMKTNKERPDSVCVRDRTRFEDSVRKTKTRNNRRDLKEARNAPSP